MSQRRLLTMIVAVTASTLAACSSDSDNDTQTGAGESSGGNVAAFVATRANDFTAGRVDRLVVDGDSFVVDGNYPGTISDLRVGTVDGDMVEVTRFGTSVLARYPADDTAAPTWEFSVNGDDVDANPQDVIFDDAGFGYVTRYGGDELWVIDPSVAADGEAQFLDMTFDLGAYDADAPNMTDMVIVDGRLFVLLERLENGFNPSQPGYIAVFDLATGLEINTGEGADGLLGIQLETVNPTALQFNENTGALYVVGRGNAVLNPDVPGDPYTGGLESIDTTTYENTLLVDDGTMADNRGFFTGGLVVSETKAYLITPTAFPNNSLMVANPSDGTIAEGTVAELTNQPISLLTQDSAGRIWVGLGGDQPGLYFLDPETDTLGANPVRTEFVPIDIAFVD